MSLLIVVACAGGSDTANDTATSDKETPNSVESENEDTNKPSTDSVSTKEIVKELLNEFSEGVFFNLLAREQVCLVEKAGADVIRQLERDFLSGGSVQEQYKEYFKALRITMKDIINQR